MKTPNVYIVTAKIIPEGNYKPLYKRGICFAYTENQAVGHVKSTMEAELDIDVSFSVQVTKIVKTYGQFVLNSAK